MPTDDTTDPTPEPVEPTTPPTTEPPADSSGLADAGKRALDAERKARSEAEKAAKAATAELDRLRKSAMSDQEKAIEAAKASARSELLAEVGAERVENAVRAAIAGRAVDADAILDGLDRAKFLNEDGRPDVAKISEWVDRIAPKPSANKPKDLGQGARPGATPPPQLSREALQGMTPKEIMAARQAGQLIALGVPPEK